MSTQKVLKTLIILLTFVIHSKAQGIDLELNAMSSAATIQSGTEGVVHLSLLNNSSLNATNVSVFVKTPYLEPVGIFTEANGDGTYDPGTGLWMLSAINAGETAVVNLTYRMNSGGIWYLEAEVYEAEQPDADSTPMNMVEGEDDMARACFSVPVNVTSASFSGMQFFVEEPKMTNITWTKDGSPYQNTNGNILQFTETGEYALQQTGFTCPDAGCCPLKVQVGTVNTACCQPMEYAMERFGNNSNQQQSQLSVELQPNADSGKDAFIWSANPDNNYEKASILNAMTWTFNGLGYSGIHSFRSMIGFDLNALPDNIIIDEAVLDLFYDSTAVESQSVDYQVNTNVQNDVYLRRIIEPWDETTVTWSNQPSYTTENEVIIPSNARAPGDVSIDITNLVKDHVSNSSTDFGIMMMLQREELYRIMIFGSSDAINENIRPKLSIKYRMVN